MRIFLGAIVTGSMILFLGTSVAGADSSTYRAAARADATESEAAESSDAWKATGAARAAEKRADDAIRHIRELIADARRHDDMIKVTYLEAQLKKALKAKGKIEGLMRRVHHCAEQGDYDCVNSLTIETETAASQTETAEGNATTAVGVGDVSGISGTLGGVSAPAAVSPETDGYAGSSGNAGFAGTPSAGFLANAAPTGVVSPSR
jgi:hypothetical protein